MGIQYAIDVSAVIICREVLEALLKDDDKKVLTEKKRSSLNAQVGVALVWLGEGEKAKQYLEMALGQPWTEEIMSPEDVCPLFDSFNAIV